MFSRLRALRAAMALGTFLLITGAAAAQATIPPDSLRGRLIDLAARAGGQVVATKDDDSDEIDALAALASLEVSNVPLGTSTGGFTFVFDKQLGIFTRSTRSFGPAFGERSLTTGKGRISIGFNALHARYDSLAGLNLSNWDLQFEREVDSYSSIKLDLASDTVVGMVGFGATENLDIGIVVPWVQVSLGADLGVFTADKVDLTPGGHALVVPRGSHSGVGDVVMFGKYRVLRQTDGGLAAEIQIRLPSGDTNNFRGLGQTRTLLSGIWSRGGKLSPHANVGFEYWSGSVPLVPSGRVAVRHQVQYAFGVGFQPHPKATILFDVIGRRQLGGGQFAYRAVPTETGLVNRLLPASKALDVISVAPGVKWNVAGNVLITGNLLAAVSNKGLRANVIPVIGAEWAF